MRVGDTAHYVDRLDPHAIETAHAAATAYGLSCPLVVTLILQESQFYHGGRWERLWNMLFLAAREIPVPLFRNKSFGLTSIKPSSAVRLIRDVWGREVPERTAATLVALYPALAIWLAAAELASFKARGASDIQAFLAYAAGPLTADALLTEPEPVLRTMPPFRRRLADYGTYYPIAVRLCVGPVQPGGGPAHRRPAGGAPIPSSIHFVQRSGNG